MSHSRRWLPVSVVAVAALFSGGSIPSSVTAASGSGVPGPGLVIRWTTEAEGPTHAVVEVSGLAGLTLQRLEKSDWSIPQWQKLLAISIEPSTSSNVLEALPMAGSYTVRSAALQFRPAFPLEPGLCYRAFFRGAVLPETGEHVGECLSAIYCVPMPAPGPTTVVTKVYPTAAVLPENLLKFYLHFSGPMSGGRIYDHIHLRNAAGRDVELPFLEIDEELWDPSMTRLTLFLDPGRIKRGVRPLEEVGPALEAGQHYKLVISREWRDAAGRPLGADCEKVFAVGPPDRESLDPAQWRIEPPPSGGHAPLVLHFPKPLDHALAERSIRVVSTDRGPISGAVELTDEERRWSFVPNGPWRRGGYELWIPATIEDLAGNNIGKPFDVDLFETVQRRITNNVEKLGFVVQ